MIPSKMKTNKIYLVGLITAAVSLTACNDVLDETNRGAYTPDYFKTEAGVEGGITSLYGNLRYLWGNGYWLEPTEEGTDEYTFGHGGNGNDLPLDISPNDPNGGGQILTADNCRADNLWNYSFRDINTANGVIENGTEAGINASLLAEARFFRAFDYFLLVQTFGGVPLDLGAGELKFNTSAVRVSARNTVAEVYTKAIFPDLINAVMNLPVAGRKSGSVTNVAAKLLLSKAYLTYAWWLENPSNIPTYPQCDRKDPDGHDASWYFQEAYKVAIDAIQNPGAFGLQPSFYLVNAGFNDRNSEILLYADHTQDDNYYDGGTNFSWANGNAPGNFARWFCRWDYTFLESSKSASAWEAQRTVQRQAVQECDRPWKQMATPIEVMTKTFADKTNDSRFDGTFAYIFKGNWDLAGVGQEVMYNANNLPVKPGDPILTFIDYEPENMQWPDANDNGGAGKSNVGAGWIPGNASWIVSPSGISRYRWLNNWKNGIYRTGDSGLGLPNGDSPRPYNILKFSELYLIAAEAAVKGAATTGTYTARNLVNVLRARAGVWTYKNNETSTNTGLALDAQKNVTPIEDHSAEMMAATPETIDIDYILAERSREFFGEGYRWHDLVRTQTWSRIAGKYSISGKTAADHTPFTVTRSIEDYHYLRPIPTSQLEALEMTDAEKKAYQNPGYSN